VTDTGSAFDDQWIVYRKKTAARELLRDALLQLPETKPWRRAFTAEETSP
jgi:hypothetical protein